MYRNHRLAHRRSLVLALALIVLAPRGALAAHEQRQESSRSVDRTIAVASGQSLRVEHRHGDVRITTHPSRELRVQATIRA